MKIKVIYLAKLAEDTGKKEEYVELPGSKLTIQRCLFKFEARCIKLRNLSSKKF